MSGFCRNVRAREIPVLDPDIPGSTALQTIAHECKRAVEDDAVDAIVLGSRHEHRPSRPSPRHRWGRTMTGWPQPR
ncbi:MAG TPA: hypothetical protein VIU11_14560 [Nakamurella sp.]